MLNTDAKINDNDRLFVASDSLRTACYFAKERNYPKARVKIIRRPSDLYGLNGAGKYLYFYGNYRKIKDFDDLCFTAQERGFDLKFV